MDRATAAARPGAALHPGALQGPAVDWAATRRVLVVRPDNLGDVLLAGPALRALRAAAPRAEITLLASPAGAAAAPLLPEIDDVLVVSPHWQLAGPPPSPDATDEQALVEQLRGFDAALVLTSFSQSPWPVATLLWLAGVPVRAGLSKEFGGAYLSHWVPAPSDSGHQVDRALHLLEAVGIPSQGSGLHAQLPEGATSPRPAGPYVVVLPGASCSSRRWEPERFRDTVTGLRERGHTVLVVGTDRELPLLEKIDDHPVTGLDLGSTAHLVAGASLAIVNNSGGMHLADALGTPQVVLFAGTEELGQYRPRTSTAVVLNRPVACSPCRAFTCPYDHECLDISAGEVVATAVGVLA